MTCRAPIKQLGSIHPIVLLYEIPTDRFEKGSNGCGYWIYTADISVEGHIHHTALPPSVWTVTITVNQTNGVASAKIEPNAGKTELISEEPLRVEGSISGTFGSGYGEKFEVIIGPDGWSSQETARSVSVPIDSDYYALCRTSHCRMRQRATVYVNLAFFVKNDTGRTAKYQASLVHNLGQLYQTSLVTDCKLVARDGAEFHAHRAILSAQSPVFAAMFENDMKEKVSGVCEIDDLNGDLLGILLKFAYTCATFQAEEKLEAVFEAADKYDMKDLREHCEELMAENVNAENAVRYLLFAKERGLKQLKVKAAKFIGDNSLEI